MRVLRSLRPLEWGLLAFVGFVVLRAGPGVFLEFRELAGLRTVSVFCAFGAMGAVRLALATGALRWGPDAGRLRRFMLTLLPVALLPLLAAIVFAAQARGLWAQVSALRLAQAIPVLSTVLLRIVGFGLPTLVGWLALNLFVKREGRLDLVAWLKEDLGALASTLREWAPLLLVLSAYAWMDTVVGGKVGEGRDAWMLAADRALFLGHDPLDLLEPFINRPLSEWLAFTYSFYAVLYPLVLGAVFMLEGNAGIRRAGAPLGLALLVGYVSYSLVPVKGPLLTRTFTVSLELYTIAPLKEAMMDANRQTWDCFPSMHTCTTLLLAFIAYRSSRRLFWVLVPFVVSMPFACVYLRYHYVVDVLAGAALAAAFIAGTRWFERRAPSPV